MPKPRRMSRVGQPTTTNDRRVPNSIGWRRRRGAAIRRHDSRNVATQIGERVERRCSSCSSRTRDRRTRRHRIEHTVRTVRRSILDSQVFVVQVASYILRDRLHVVLAIGKTERAGTLNMSNVQHLYPVHITIFGSCVQRAQIDEQQHVTRQWHDRRVAHRFNHIFGVQTNQIDLFGRFSQNVETNTITQIVGRRTEQHLKRRFRRIKHKLGRTARTRIVVLVHIVERVENDGRVVKTETQRH